MRKNKKGNIIIVVVCIVLALMVTLAYLLKNTTSRMHTTKKLGSTLYARELANTLAKLSIQYLNQRLIDNGDEISQILSLPLNDFKDSGEKNLLPKIKSITKSDDNSNILDLISSKSSLKNLKIEKLYWQVFKDDFKPIDVNKQNPYSREKYGLVHLFINFSYLLPGKKNTDKERNKETYHFVSDIKVVANIIPVLSRFSLYIDDALDGNKEDLDRFNVVDTNADGLLKNRNANSYIPWILNNHGDKNKKVNGIDRSLKSYSKIIESSRGLVFLGGGSFEEEKGIRLGLAFGESDKNSPYGEGFQFFYTEDTGYWKNQSVKENFDSWKGNVGILTANFGLCNEPEKDQPEDTDNFDPEMDDDFEDDDYNTYFEYVGGSDSDKLNSIFRLYGTDDFPSPTLVFGYVDAKYAAVKQFRFGDEDFEYDLLANYSTVSEFKEASAYDYDNLKDAEEGEEDDKESLYDDNLSHFAFSYRDAHSHKRLEFLKYITEFSSKVELDGYNKGYSYALNHFEEFPFKHNVIEGDEFKRIFNKKDKDIFINVPSSKDAKYDSIYSEAKLGEINKFLDLNKLNINDFEKTNRNLRIAHSLKLTSYEPEYKSIDCFYTKNTEVDLIKYFKSKGLLINNKLNLNGWLFINNEADTDLILNFKDIKLVSHGGIILSNGNLKIKSDIISDSDASKKILTIITLGDNKDIIIDENVNRLDVSLISKDGQVKLKGRGNIQQLEIDGNIVMKKIHSGDEGIKAMMRGVNLVYNKNLAALPFKNTDQEKNLLMFNLNNNPKIIK